MYKFVDTIEVSDGANLPSEALKINGEYIENLIPGYRTLNVSGREALSPELSHYETGTRDGSVRKSKRYPARTIIVTYQIIAESNTAFRNAYNTLASILDVEDAELIFDDEPDKFFIGTPYSIGEVEPGSNAVTAEFEIICEDPFKYSVQEYEVAPIKTTETDEEGNTVTGLSFVVNYGGTYKSFPIMDASIYSEYETSEDGETANQLTGSGDCGFIAYFNEEGKIIQLGDPDESDGEDFEPSQTLVSQSFENSKAWGTAAQALWTMNAGVALLNAMAQTGTLNMKKLTNTDYYLTPKSWGSGKLWHGPVISRAIPADDTGVSGAENFTFTYSQKMCLYDSKQIGSFHAFVVSGSGDGRETLAGVNISKGKSGKVATLDFIVGGKVLETMDIDLTKNNAYFGEYKKATKKAAEINPVRTTIIKKTGDTITFNVAGIKKSYQNSDLEKTLATEVMFAFGRHSSKAVLARNGLYSAKFVKDNCTTWREVPNKFSSGDVVTAECRNGKIYLNNAPTPEYGALGNDWEEFYLKPGENLIGIAYSDWIEDAYAPTFKLKYREVFL